MFKLMGQTCEHSNGFLELTSRKQVERLCKKCCIGLTSNLKPGKHLAYGHPSNERIRQWVAFQVETGNVHSSLICNFDQVWSMNWRPRKRVLQKKNDDGVNDPISKNLSLRKIRHAFERFMGGGLTEAMLPADVHEVAAAEVSGKMAANIPIESFRLPHTLTTLSWSTGHVGRGFITVRSDHLSEAVRAELNQDILSSIC